MSDYAALQVALDTDMRYDESVRGPSLTPIAALLHELDGREDPVEISCTANALRSAVGDGLRGLNQVQVQRLLFLTQQDGEVDMADAGIRAEVFEILSGSATAQTRLADVSSRPAQYCDAFGFERVSKEDLWRVLPGIPKAYMSPESTATREEGHVAAAATAAFGALEEDPSAFDAEVEG